MSERNANTLPQDALAAAHQTIVLLEAKLDAMSTRLIKAEESKSRFISHALNELNNPLTAIIGLSEQLMSMQQPSWEHTQRSLQWVHDEGAYLEFQLKNLLMAGELEAGVARMNRSRIDIFSLLNSVTNRYLALAQRKGITLESNGGDELLSMAGAVRHFHTDGAILALIFTNLLDNAVKFSPPQGVVRISVDINAAGLDISIRDHGPGISSLDKPHIFDRFWQSDGSTTKLYRGLGLGLSISFSCAELLVGSLALDDKNTSGAYFRLHVPALSDADLVDTPEEDGFFFNADDQGDAAGDETY